MPQAYHPGSILQIRSLERISQRGGFRGPIHRPFRFKFSRDPSAPKSICSRIFRFSSTFNCRLAPLTTVAPLKLHLKSLKRNSSTRQLAHRNPRRSRHAAQGVCRQALPSVCREILYLFGRKARKMYLQVKSTENRRSVKFRSSLAMKELMEGNSVIRWISFSVGTH